MFTRVCGGYSVGLAPKPKSSFLSKWNAAVRTQEQGDADEVGLLVDHQTEVVVEHFALGGQDAAHLVGQLVLGAVLGSPLVGRVVHGQPRQLIQRRSTLLTKKNGKTR